MTPNDLYAGTHRTQFDGSPLAGQNCTPTSGANGARAATGGRVDKSGAEIRALVKVSEETNPATPGWSLDDLQLAMGRLGVRYEIRRGVWSNIVSAHDTGLAIALQGDSDQFSDGTCSGAFDGDHCVAIHPGTYGNGDWSLADPICKGRRPEKPAVLRDYATKFAAKVAGRPTSVIRYGVFLDPVPREADMDVRAIKGEDWKPKANASGASNGVLRPSPELGGPVLVRLPLGTIVRSIAEIRTAAPTDFDWRLTEYQGQPAYMLRRDWDPLVPGGDPATDAALTAYIARTPAPLPDCSAAVQAEYDRMKGGTTATATVAFPEPPA